MIRVVSTDSMRISDAKTQADGTSGRELMFRAGKAIYDLLEKRGKTAVLCGSGNNAGDGFVVAYLLAENGYKCKIFLCSDRFSADGRYYFERCKEKGVPYVFCNGEEDFSSYAVVVDCLLGTGFKGELSGIYAEVVKKINESASYVVSADINSGLNGDGGTGDICVKSDLTVSIGFPKTGHFAGRAKDVIGRLVNVDIGIKLYGDAYNLLEKEDVKKVFPERKNYSHKGTYGYVGLIGGCTRYSGAPRLAMHAAAAMRAGAGVVRLAVPESIKSAFFKEVTEATLFFLPDDGEGLVFDESTLEEFLKGLTSVTIGMGLGNGKDNLRILNYILHNFKGTVIVDADGLNAISRDLGVLKGRTCKNLIFTPHVKEFSRLSGYSAEEILAAPVEKAKEFASRYDVTVLLKGTATVVTDGKEVYLVDRGCPGMATAGSGDVLSGILAGISGYNDPFDAEKVACGAFLNGFAGETAQRKINPVSMTASDTVNALADAVSEILKN